MAGELNGPHRVIVVGGGFAGLLATRVLARAQVDVTLIDRSTNHVFQPLLYQFATGILSEGQIAPPLRAVVHRHKNVRVLMAEVTGFDLEQRSVAARRPDGESIVLRYDYGSASRGTGSAALQSPAIARFPGCTSEAKGALHLKCSALRRRGRDGSATTALLGKSLPSSSSQPNGHMLPANRGRRATLTEC
jgi:NADH dehydrogenase